MKLKDINIVLCYSIRQNYKHVELRLANKIFLAKGTKQKAEFKEVTGTYFRSEAQSLDFYKAVEASKTINDWCEKQTNHRIKDLIKPGNSIFRYKRPKRAVRTLRVWKCRTSSERIGCVTSCIEPCFSLQMHAKPELAHRLQTSKMRRNPISLNSCQHDDIYIVTVSVARRLWTAPLKPRRPCVKHFTL